MDIINSRWNALMHVYNASDAAVTVYNTLRVVL